MNAFIRFCVKHLFNLCTVALSEGIAETQFVKPKMCPSIGAALYVNIDLL